MVFDVAAFEEYDAFSKAVVIRWLNRRGVVVVDNTLFDRYAVDLLVGGVVPGDVEVRPEWNDDVFPFGTVHVPVRKEKFMLEGDFLYFVLDKSLTRLLMTNGERIRSSPVEVVRTWRGDDAFFVVPIGCFERFDLGVNG